MVGRREKGGGIAWVGLIVGIQGRQVEFPLGHKSDFDIDISKQLLYLTVPSKSTSFENISVY